MAFQVINRVCRKSCTYSTVLTARKQSLNGSFDVRQIGRHSVLKIPTEAKCEHNSNKYLTYLQLQKCSLPGFPIKLKQLTTCIAPSLLLIGLNRLFDLHLKARCRRLQSLNCLVHETESGNSFMGCGKLNELLSR